VTVIHRFLPPLAAAALLAAAACGTAREDAAARADTIRVPAPAFGGTAPRTVADGDTGRALPFNGETVVGRPGDPGFVFAPVRSRPETVDSIRVLRGGVPVQTLVPGENLVVGDIPPADRISTPDLDYDGHPDLALLAETAMANSRSEYWRFDARMSRFVPLGQWETLMPDSAAREWHSHNRGGHGGRLWTAARYRVVDGKLEAVREEAQDWLEDAGTYVHIVRERRGGRMAETRRDTLADAEVRSGPSWMPDR
jgi:hypothetical protein